jgi:hypothetical protein
MNPDEGGAVPQYMLLIYPQVDAPRPTDRLPRWQKYTDDLIAEGALVSHGRLQEVDSATTVKVHDGETLISDGPFAESKEYLAGFFLVDCEHLDEALRIAAGMPVDDYATVEVRPMMFPANTTAEEMANRAEA